MAWVCEVTVTGMESERASLDEWLAATALAAWTSLARLSALDIYEPAAERGHDPYNHAAQSPLLIAILAFDTAQALRDATGSAAFLAPLQALPAGLQATSDAFERRLYPVDGTDAPAPLTAPVSYVVRYDKPAEDEAAFIDNYIASHPPTQAKLPRIRAILCYLPRPDLAAAWKRRDYLIGNEVAFDSVEDFNAAMRSPVREELRAHFREFPPFSGVNSHHLMRRRRVLG